MNKIVVLTVFVALVIFSGYLFLQKNPTILNNFISRSSFSCLQDTDCIYVCGSCENISYFHSNPPSSCSIPANQTGARKCFCENGQCAIPTNITTQPPYQQPESIGFNNFYVAVGIIVVVAFILVGLFINYLMKSPTETW